MKILRWIAFLPLAWLWFAVIHLFGFKVSLKAPWWGTLLFYIIVILPLAESATIPAIIAPKREVGGVLMLILLAYLEIPFFYEAWPLFGWSVLFWRILADFLLVKRCLKAVLEDDLDFYKTVNF